MTPTLLKTAGAFAAAAAIAAAAIGLTGSESVVLRKVISWSFILLAILCLLTGLMSTPVLAWLLP